MWTNWRAVHLQVSPFLLPALQISATTFSQYSILRSPASIAGLSFLGCCSVHEVRDIWLSCLVFRGLSDAVEASTSGVLSLHRETKFIIGFDFAVTLSSPESFFVLFDITSEHSVELTWLMLNNHKRWFHSSRVKFPLVSMSASWFWCQCIWFGFWSPHWFDRITSQEQLRESWKHVTLSGFFQLWSSWSLLRCLQTHTTKLPDEKIGRLREKMNSIQIIDHSLRLLAFVTRVRWRTNFTSVL